MKDFQDFERYESRLDLLNGNIRCAALEYASQIYAQKKISREEALERGITRAMSEMKRPDQ